MKKEVDFQLEPKEDLWKWYYRQRMWSSRQGPKNERLIQHKFEAWYKQYVRIRKKLATPSRDLRKPC